MNKELDKALLDYSGEVPEEYTIPDGNIPPTHNQYTGTTSNQCMAYAAAGIMRILNRLWTGEDIRFSMAYIYGKYRREANRTGSCMFVSDLIPGLSEGGAIPFDTMPDLKEPEECYDYVIAHPELEETAKAYAKMFKGFVNLKDKTKLKTFENIKKALLAYNLPLYGEMVGHGVIFCGFKGEYVLYRDSDGTDKLKQLHYKKIKESYLFVMADKGEKAGNPSPSPTEIGNPPTASGSPSFTQGGLGGEEIGKEGENMNIIETKFFWNGALAKRARTDYIVLHHRAGNGDADSIHNQHLSKGWAGIGYHFYVRKDGLIYRGRPIETIGAHTEGKNSVSVGVCFEGNYHETDKIMPSEQLKAGQELIAYLKGLYPNAEIKGHRDLQATGCPGQYFPFDKIKKGKIGMDIEKAKKVLKEKAGLDDSTIMYLMFYKYGKELVIKLAEAMEA